MVLLLFSLSCLLPVLGCIVEYSRLSYILLYGWRRRSRCLPLTTWKNILYFYYRVVSYLSGFILTTPSDLPPHEKWIKIPFFLYISCIHMNMKWKVEKIYSNKIKILGVHISWVSNLFKTMQLLLFHSNKMSCVMLWTIWSHLGNFTCTQACFLFQNVRHIPLGDHSWTIFSSHYQL